MRCAQSCQRSLFMHFVLLCYLQYNLWGEEMQQAVSQGGDCCSWAKQPHLSPRLCHRGWVTALGQTPVQRPLAKGSQRPWANTKGGQRAGDVPRIGSPSARCARHSCTWPHARQIASCFALGPWVILLPSGLDTEIPSTCATR